MCSLLVTLSSSLDISVGGAVGRDWKPEGARKVKAKGKGRREEEEAGFLGRGDEIDYEAGGDGEGDGDVSDDGEDNSNDEEQSLDEEDEGEEEEIEAMMRFKIGDEKRIEGSGLGGGERLSVAATQYVSGPSKHAKPSADTGTGAAKKRRVYSTKGEMKIWGG